MRSKPFLISAVTFALAACATVTIDPGVSTDTALVETKSSALFSELRGQQAPACGFDAHASQYADLNAQAAALVQRVSNGPKDADLQRAVEKLADAVAKAEQAHRQASANTADPAGLCLAPEVIDLNANAIAGATAAILNMQRMRGGEPNA